MALFFSGMFVGIVICAIALVVRELIDFDTNIIITNESDEHLIGQCLTCNTEISWNKKGSIGHYCPNCGRVIKKIIDKE